MFHAAVASAAKYSTELTPHAHNFY